MRPQATEQALQRLLLRFAHVQLRHQVGAAGRTQSQRSFVAADSVCTARQDECFTRALALEASDLERGRPTVQRKEDAVACHEPLVLWSTPTPLPGHVHLEISGLSMPSV